MKTEKVYYEGNSYGYRLGYNAWKLRQKGYAYADIGDRLGWSASKIRLEVIKYKSSRNTRKEEK